MLLALFGSISLNAFFGEITGYTAAVVLYVNLYLIYSYCNLTGTPYKSKKAYESVRWLGIVGGYWSAAFGLKFVGVFLGSSLYQVNSSEQSNEQEIQAYQASFIGMCDFVTIIIPLFFVTDTKFIKIFAGKYVEKRLPGAHESLLEDSADVKLTNKKIGIRDSALPD